MNLVKSSDFITLLPAMIPCAGALLILLVQISLPKFRLSLGYWLSVFFLFATLFFIGMNLEWDGGYLSGFATAIFPSLLNLIIPAYDAKVTAFGGQISWGRFEAMYSFIIIAIAIMVLLLSRKILTKLNLHLVEAYQMMLFSIAGLILFICSYNLIVLFIALELASIPIFVLAGWNRSSKSSNEAGIKYFLLSAFSMAFILLGIAFVYGACGSVEFSTIIKLFNEEGPIVNVNFLKIGLTLLIFGLSFKIALFPLHAWVADVYEGSITIFTAFMAALIKIASIGVTFKLLKTFSSFIALDVATIESPLYLILVILSVSSMFYGNITALAQKNLKRLFAYSSIAHAGYMASLFPLAFSSQHNAEASMALFFYVTGYAITSTLSFGLIAFLELSAEGDKKIITLDSLKGLSEKNPYIAFLLSISVFSFAGIPPLVGFYGKFYILKTLLNAKMFTLAIFLSVNSLIAVFYYARIFLNLYWFDLDETKKTESSKEKVSLFDLSSLVSISILSLAVIALGVLSGFFIR